MKESKSLYDLTEEIRKLINDNEKQYFLIQNKPMWNQLCSSLNTIEDTDVAIKSYEDLDENQEDGVKYLMLYGVLQSLYVQQDAVRNLCEVLDIKISYKDYPNLENIRIIRHKTTGHPTKITRKTNGIRHQSSYVMKFNTSKDYTLASYSDRGKDSFSEISIINLIKPQRETLSKILTAVIKTLKKEKKEFKRKYKEDKLSSVIPQTSDYHIQKFFDVIWGEGDPKITLAIDFKSIQHIFEDLKNKLKAKGLSIDTYGSIKEIYDFIEYPMEALKTYLLKKQNREETNINDITAHIFVFFIQYQIEQLRNILKEIDEEIED